MNAPNLVTITRILMVPLFVVLGYGKSAAAATAAFAVFLVASLSDSLDGYLARRGNLESRFGAFLDPLADKLLVGAALFVLVDTRAFPWWAAAIVAVREVAVQVLRTRIVNGGGTLPASRRAKEKTFLQVLMVCWWLWPWDDVTLAHGAITAITLVWTVWTGAEYFAARRDVEERVA
ncbi:MAG TPA: CDP-diacylglycerol--glycerol-3-phosphate 3-phosphatidyltransferase [Actinomycetota bacterium]|nr:CDP-diacylglycerol--glycerol-3-phosphate 3-phosphatidyltransferase [Actinomycetota bacterium]